MRIGIDNISTGESTGLNAPGGMRSYLEAMVTGFTRLHPDHTLIVFSSAQFEPFSGLPSNVKFVQLPFVPRQKILRIVYQQTVLPFFASLFRLDVFFAIATVCPLLMRVPIVLTVQFLQIFSSDAAGRTSRFRTAYLRKLLPWSVRKAIKVIIFTKSGMEDLVRNTAAPESKIRIVPHGLNADISRCPAETPLPQSFGIPPFSKYVVFVSATYWYKNHVTLIRAFAMFARRSDEPILLVLAGAEVDVPFTRLREVARECGIESRVHILGRIETVANLYSKALLSVFPSTSETFGFPILEAMACGCPVVTANYGSMAELAGDAGILVNPLDEPEMANAIERVAVDPTLRTAMIERGLKRSREFTWDRAAERTLDLLESTGESRYRLATGHTHDADPFS